MKRIACALFLISVISSCASRTERRDTSDTIAKIFPRPLSSAYPTSVGTPYIPKKALQAKLFVNISMGLSCINQKYSLNIVKNNKLVFVRDLNSETSTTIDSDFDQGEHKINLVNNFSGKTVDAVTIDLSKDNDQQNIHLTACK